MNLEDKYRPTDLDGFAGRTVAKKILKALVRKPFSSAWALLGGPGTGKTSMAFMVGKLLKAEIHHMPSRTCNLEVVEDLVRGLRHSPMFEKWRVVIFDEADKMTLAAQHVLLSVLDGTIKLQDVIFFFTANPGTDGEVGLEPRFLSRCKKIVFNADAEIDIAVEYLTEIWRKESRKKVPDLRQLLMENRGDIRGSLNAMELELIAAGSSISAKVEEARGGNRKITSITAPLKGGKGKLLYTIGYENLDPLRFRKIVDKLGITLIVDVRGVPSSRIGGFSMTTLQNDYGTKYVWKGEILGTRASGVKGAGVKWLADLMRDPKQIPLLLGKEESPGACHRHFNIAVPLARRNGIDAQHICDDELILSSDLQKALDENTDYEYYEFAI